MSGLESQPPILQGPECLTTAEACASCFFTVAEHCGILATAQARIQAEERAAKAQERITQLEADNGRMLMDPLVEGFVAANAIPYHIANSQQLQRGLRNNTLGMLFLDIRGVQLSNKGGQEFGDRLIAASGAAISQSLTENIRTKDGDRKHGAERRKNPKKRDTRLRIGGDEFAVLCSEVSPEELSQIAERVAEGLSIEQAIETDRQGNIPVMASVGFAHSRDLPANPHGNRKKYWTEADYLERYKQLRRLADAAHVAGGKQIQYAEMAKRTGIEYVPSKNERIIAETFYQRYLPNFTAERDAAQQAAKDQA